MRIWPRRISIFENPERSPTIACDDEPPGLRNPKKLALPRGGMDKKLTGKAQGNKVAKEMKTA
ncbi:hypothetical protein [Phormidium sp. CCY1219]|uniref:hypothetical protein n=1 Tax=Phormidium sp. CCY1219 TaxID=2886104 RepID=UPI002D1F6827|nr:hypothetical protein [Phormidium sp. CCY1219]MEB3831281.1 hypothetical protein [Phormidium sp. CCY1219]